MRMVAVIIIIFIDEEEIIFTIQEFLIQQPSGINLYQKKIQIHTDAPPPLSKAYLTSTISK